MHIISKKKLRDYYKLNTNAELPLVEWYMIMKELRVNNIHELKSKFNSIDYVNGYTVFNIGGNSYRLITAIHYNKQTCYIRCIWTHAEYSKCHNQDKLQRGNL